MIGQINETKGSFLTSEVRREIVESYLVEGVRMAELSTRYGVTVNHIKQMVFRYRQSLSIFDEQKTYSVMQPNGKRKRSYDAIRSENDELKRQLRIAMLKIEGYELMDKILRDEYGIAFSKKSVAKQSVSSSTRPAQPRI